MMRVRPSPLSKAGVFPKSSLLMGVPTTIRVVSSTVSLSSAITLDDDLSAGLVVTMGPIHSSGPTSKSEVQPLSPIPSPPRKSGQRARRGRIRDGLSQSEHCPPSSSLRREEELVARISEHRDLPPNPKILPRRSTEPLPSEARRICLQDLGCLEDGRKSMLVNRFAPLPREEDYIDAPPPLPRSMRGSSDESYASMPLRMPVRKASVEEIRLGL